MPSIIQWVEGGEQLRRVLQRHSSDECPCSFPNIPKHYIFYKYAILGLLPPTCTQLNKSDDAI
jgi:hypothetical protein